MFTSSLLLLMLNPHASTLPHPELRSHLEDVGAESTLGFYLVLKKLPNLIIDPLETKGKGLYDLRRFY